MINSITNTIAEILPANDENIKICANKLLNGEVIGFPTETVYGLGANALNIEAVKKIFEYKGRPLSDPLIVHVTSLEMAMGLTDINENCLGLFKLLANKFWPGPLTMVLKANFDKLSPILTANTQFIGIRIPNNEIARKLIEFSGVPIAAPSANKFCHISPVNPYHVLEDFKEFDVTILDGGVCNFCMESTVIKLFNDKIQILRMGAISPKQLEDSIEEKFDKKCSVEILKKNINHSIPSDDQLQIEAPGQFMKHYSPKLDTYVYDEEYIHKINLDSTALSEEKIVFLDYQNRLKNKLKLNKKFLIFLDLSEKGNAEEVMLNLYDYLHNAEKIEGASKIIICDLEKYMNDTPHKFTLVDRILKASAFKKINFEF